MPSAIVAGAIVTLQAGLTALGPVFAAAGINTAAISAALGAGYQVAVLAGPAAPFVVAALYLGNALRKITKSRKNLDRCRDEAGLWALEMAGENRYVRRLSTFDTPGNAELCFHRGKKTKNMKKGRTSQRIPLTVLREDVVDGGMGWGVDIATIIIGRRLYEDEILVVPWLGQFALSRGVARSGDLVGWFPMATAACIGATNIMLERGDASLGIKKMAVRLAQLGVRTSNDPKASKVDKANGRELAALCAGIAMS